MAKNVNNHNRGSDTGVHNNNSAKSANVNGLKKAHADARTTKEKTEARKAMTLAVFNSAYEEHNKKR